VKQLIFISWLCILAGIVLVLFISAGVARSPTVGLLYGLGQALLMAPNAIWIVAANRISSAAVSQRPSTLISVLAITFILGVLISFGLLGSATPENGRVLEWALTLVFPTAMISLITAVILVSRRVVDSEDSPELARGSRIFVLCLGFFYIAIGMFFIAPRLKRLEVKTGR
jgi:hydrogenase-4 membrane subunit HyfE